MITLLDTTGDIHLTLDELHLYSTYEDWLMGGPKASEMEDLMRRWEARARTMYKGWPVHSVPASRDSKGFLPLHVCIGFFSASETRDPGMSASALVIVWYQQTCPVDRIELPQIADATWRNSAKDFDY